MGTTIESLDVSVTKGHRNVVLLAGSNNISSRDSPYAIGQKFKDAIKRIKSNNPDCRLFFQEIFPRYDIQRSNKIKAANSYLKSLCNQLEVTMMPCPDLDEEDYSMDGLHLNYWGKQKLRNSITAHLGRPADRPTFLQSNFPNQSLKSTTLPLLIQSPQIIMHYIQINVLSSLVSVSST